jgi:hypothetical protein
LGALHDLAAKYDGQIRFLVVYICEAHPTDGWQVDMNIDDNVLFADPTSDEERVEVATACALRLNIDMPVVIDPIDDRLASAYGALPDRLYLVGTDGRITFQGDEGPWGFNPQDLEAAIASAIG